MTGEAGIEGLALEVSLLDGLERLGDAVLRDGVLVAFLGVVSTTVVLATFGAGATGSVLGDGLTLGAAAGAGVS